MEGNFAPCHAREPTPAASHVSHWYNWARATSPTEHLYELLA